MTVYFTTIILWGQSWRRDTKCDCKFDFFSTVCGFDLHSRKLNIILYLLIYISISSLWCRGEALSSSTQHAMRLKFGGKWGTECLYTNNLILIILLFILFQQILFSFLEKISFLLIVLGFYRVYKLYFGGTVMKIKILCIELIYC